ncbi:MAG: Rrf2 family transcriptional regulator [Candidatus Levyibacteriota bacterium]
MIRFSKKEDYAMILLNELFKNYNKRLVPLSEVACNFNISALFLRNLANQLSKMKIIKAVEGKNGGYFLNKNPKELKIGEILGAFSDKPFLQCCSQSLLTRCPREKICQVSSIWKKINVEFLNKIYNLSFYEFINMKPDVKIDEK